MRVISAIFLILLSSCATATQRRPVILSPYGVRWEAPITVQYIEPGSPAERRLRVGDTLVAIGDQKVPNLLALNLASLWVAEKITFRRSDGNLVTLPANTILDRSAKHLYFRFLKKGQTLLSEEESLYAKTQLGGFLFAGKAVAVATAALWRTTPRYIEVKLDIQVPAECTQCRLDNVGLLDASRNSWLSPVSASYPAYAIYPDLGPPP